MPGLQHSGDLPPFISSFSPPDLPAIWSFLAENESERSVLRPHLRGHLDSVPGPGCLQPIGFWLWCPERNSRLCGSVTDRGAVLGTEIEKASAWCSRKSCYEIKIENKPENFHLIHAPPCGHLPPNSIISVPWTHSETCPFLSPPTASWPNWWSKQEPKMHGGRGEGGNRVWLKSIHEGNSQHTGHFSGIVLLYPLDRTV